MQINHPYHGIGDNIIKHNIYYYYSFSLPNIVLNLYCTSFNIVLRVDCLAWFFCSLQSFPSASRKQLVYAYFCVEKNHKSLIHGLTMKLYIPKYSELLTSYFSIIQFCPPDLMCSELSSKFPYIEGVKFLLSWKHRNL